MDDFESRNHEDKSSVFHENIIKKYTIKANL